LAKVPKSGVRLHSGSPAVHTSRTERTITKSQALMFPGEPENLEPEQVYIVEINERKSAFARTRQVRRVKFSSGYAAFMAVSGVTIIRGRRGKDGWHTALSLGELRRLKELEYHRTHLQKAADIEPDESEIAAQTLEPETYKLALEIFGSDEEIWIWLKEPNVFLGNKCPVDILKTENGVRRVLTYLSKIESGTYV